MGRIVRRQMHVCYGEKQELAHDFSAFGGMRNMQAVDRELLSVLSDGTIRFVVPVYQRSYAWDKGHWETLWHDIIEIANTPERQHFTGSIVWVGRIQGPGENADGNILVDGQQRLATLSLIILAYAEYAKEHGNKSSNGEELPVSYEDIIAERYILYPTKKGEQRYKITLSDVDKSTFRALTERLVSPNTPIPETKSKLVKALDYFRAKISGMDDQSLLWRGLQRLSIVNVTLNPIYDNPQLVFESMNATGKPLNVADLIRNYILLGLPIDIQNEYYNNFWRQIELTLGTDENAGIFDQFIFHYLTLYKSPTFINQSEIYKIFKDHKDVCGLSTEALLKEMLSYAKIYTLITESDKGNDKEISEILNSINTIKATNFIPLIMLFYDQYQKNPDTFSREEFILSIKIIETYLVYRAICEYGSSSFSKYVPSLISKFKETFNNYDFNVAKHLLASFEDERGTARDFPLPSQVLESLKNKKFYKLARERKKFFLEKLENSFHPKNKIDIMNGKYTIEHVMPQDIDKSKEWQTMLGENYAELHDDYLHLLGNLTITAYNSELSNMPFSDKKQKYLETEPIALTKDIISEQEWTFEKIKERTIKLSKKLIDIWPRQTIDPQDVKEYALLRKDTDTNGAYVPIQKLMLLGILLNGEKLVTPEGSMYSGISCSINADGKFIFEDGKITDSPTGAAKYAMKLLGKQVTTTNGWTFWYVSRLGCKLSEVKKFMGCPS